MFDLVAKKVAPLPDGDEFLDEEFISGKRQDLVERSEKLLLRLGTEQTERRGVDPVDLDARGQLSGGVGMSLEIVPQVVDARLP